MLKAIGDAFTIIHIRISSAKLFGICARHFITGGLIVFIILNTVRLFTTISNLDIGGFIEASIFIIVTLFICIAWISAWPEAGKMLNKAVGYEEGLNDRHEKHHNHKKK